MVVSSPPDFMYVYNPPVREEVGYPCGSGDAPDTEHALSDDPAPIIRPEYEDISDAEEKEEQQPTDMEKVSYMDVIEVVGPTLVERRIEYLENTVAQLSVDLVTALERIRELEEAQRASY